MLLVHDAYVYTTAMTLAMDGVRSTPKRPRSLPTARPKSVVGARQPQLERAAVVATATTQRYVVGMDGIRRPVPQAVSEMVQPAPVAKQPVFAPTPAIPMPAAPAVAASAPMASAEVAAEATQSVWRLPSLRLPHIHWRRQAVAFGLVATALVASTAMVRLVATPQKTTARAAVERPATTPAPAATATPAPTPQSTGLQQLVDTFAAKNPGKFGIVVKDLSTGETATSNADAQITSASLYKLFVAQRIYQRIDIGQLDYSKSAGGGTGRNIDGCLTIMINISDNGCGRALGSMLGWGAQDQALLAEGYKETSLATPQKTSAADVAMLFERLYNGTLVSGDSSKHFMNLLKSQRVNNRLPVGLPAGTVIAHKTGDLNGVMHDGGIVYGPKTNYIVVVTSGPWATPGVAPAKFADLSAQLWNHFER